MKPSPKLRRRNDMTTYTIPENGSITTHRTVDTTPRYSFSASPTITGHTVVSGEKSTCATCGELEEIEEECNGEKVKKVIHPALEKK